MNKENTLLNANEIYYKPVEDESALQLELEANLKSQLAGLIESRFQNSLLK